MMSTHEKVWNVCKISEHRVRKVVEQEDRSEDRGQRDDSIELGWDGRER